MGDEYAGIVVVDEIHHSLGVGESLRVELEAAPFVLFPVEPVLHHHVNRYLALAELTEHAFHLSLCVIFLTALPESERPLWHHLCTTGEEAVALDDVVVAVACYEVIVHLLVHLCPYRHAVLLLFGLGSSGTQSAVSHATVWLPFHSQRGALTLLQVNLKLVCIGIPCRSPTLGHYEAAIHIYLYIARIVENETVFGCLRSLDGALIYDVRLAEVDVLRQIAHHA